MSSNPIIRRATYGDAVAFYGGDPLYSFKGYVVELNGDIVGLAGIYYEDGKPIVFSEMKDAMRPYKKAIAKTCRLIMRMLDDLGRAAYAFAAPSEPTSGYLLAKLGFKPTGQFGVYGDILVREADHG